MQAIPRLGLRLGVVIPALLLVSVTLIGVPRADAYCQPSVALLLPADGTSADFAATSVSVSGQVAVIGAPGQDDAGRDAGAAYVFRHGAQGWKQEQRLIPSMLGPDNNSGQAVAASDDVVLVAARGQGDFGAVYVFRYNGSAWVQETALMPSDGVLGDNFGYAVAVSGNVALIGAYGVDDFGTSSGAAYVFRYNGSRWQEEAKLHASDAAASDFFGVGVALDGNVAVVGAYLDDDLGTSSGSAYVFRYNGTRWIQEGKLLADDGVADDRFGAMLSVSGNRIVAGVEQHNAKGASAGAAYVFGFDGTRWSQQAAFLASDGVTNDRFGASVAIDHDTIVVGAPGHDVAAVTDAGAAYVYEFDGIRWIESATLAAPDGWYWDYFGTAVDIDRGTTVVGAPQDDNMGNNSGSLYVFEDPCASSGCTVDRDCDDGLYCNGAETCVGGACQPGSSPCGSGLCNESTNACVDCLTNADCSDGQFCNGAESCIGGVCQPGSSPCGSGLCNETTNACVDCLTNADCSDGQFCNGIESCVGGACQPGSRPCGDGACNESTNACVDCLTNADCNDGLFCNGDETCVGGACQEGTASCQGVLCSEETDACLDCLTNADCDDGNECTDDICDPAVGCRSMNNTNTCTPAGTCLGSGVCDAGACTCIEDPILVDLPAFLDCMRGPDRYAHPRCLGFDVNPDNIIDMRDFGELNLQ